MKQIQATSQNTTPITTRPPGIKKVDTGSLTKKQKMKKNSQTKHPNQTPPTRCRIKTKSTRIKKT